MNARALIRIGAATVVANALAAAIVWACGPHFATLPTVTILEPFDDAAFARGEIGVIRPRFRRATLAMAYRVLSGRPPLNVNYESDGSRTSDEDQWRKIRDQVLGSDNATSAPTRTRRVQDYVTPINCLEDAYGTSVRTFADRQLRYGAESGPVKAWVQAQAAVFANCDEEPLSLPEPAPASADALTKADRAYQTAAAHFYGMQYDEAERRFRAIAEDASSPWRPYGRYLAARSILRLATMGVGSDDAKQQALRDAEQELLAVVRDPIAAPVHSSARGLLTFVRIRLRPLDELRTRALRIATTPDEVPRSELDDFTYLLDHQVGDTVDFEYRRLAFEAMRGSHDLVDWILALQGTGPEARDRAIGRWQETRSVPWLVAALTQLQGPHDAANLLLDAAAAVPASSPAFATVAFLRARLLIALDRIDAARQLLATLPDAEGPGVSAETINLYRGERLMVAATLEELLKSAPRQTLLAPLITFDEDAAVVMTQRLPLDRLIEAGLSTALPPRVRTRVSVAAFTRAILLGRHDRARRIAPALRRLVPALATDIDRYMRETTIGGQRRAAVLLILRTPGMRRDVRGLEDNYSMDLVEPRRAFESFSATWWCAPFSSGAKRVAGEASSELIHTLYPDHIVPYPSFVTVAERSVVEHELAAIDATGHATKFLATAALEWARERPADPEAAEALARIVAGWRRACRDNADAELSRRSFQALHRQFPNSEWAKRTKYWYR